MAARARPAASLILLCRNASGQALVFMGRRNASLKFLPGYLVFPGGRVERQDYATSQAPLDLACGTVLDAELGGIGGMSATAYANAALRECAEETGLDAERHLAAPLRYIARAITPPRFPIRYDTRFFLGTLANSQLPARIASGDGELVSP
ncbi:MAG: hydrolase, partial [Devosiaceae bacterium]